MVYRADIDGLRAIAVVAVMLFHFDVAPFQGGFVGVDVFFVISGFLITSIIVPELAAGTFSIGAFYERRIRRLFPALFTVLVASSFLASVMLLPADLGSFSKSLAAASLFSANIYYFRTSGYFDVPSELKPLLHTWSLAVEEQFYIVYPPLLFLAYRLLRDRVRILIGLLALVSFVASLYAVHWNPSAAFYLPFFRAWELFLGAVLAIDTLPRITPRARDLLGITGLAAIVFSTCAFSEATVFPGASALIPCLGTAAIIYAGRDRQTLVSGVLSWKPIVFIGLASYSLYLWHWPMVVFTKYYLARDLSAFEKLVLILTSVALAIVSLRFVENPIRRKTGARRTIFAVAAAGVIVLVTVGVGGRNGFPGRFDRVVLEAAATVSEPRPYLSCLTTPDSCTLGIRSADPTFLVWGDSHALALAPGIDRVAQREGRAGLLAARPACPPLLGMERTYHGNDCREFNASVVETLRRRSSVRTVILVGRWALSTTGLRYGEESGEPVILSPRGIEDNPRVFAEGLERTIQFLDAGFYEVILVTQVPEIGWAVPSVLARSLLYQRAAPIGPALDEYRQRQKLMSRILDRLRKNYRFRVVDVAPILCPKDFCKVDESGRALYRDEHHLSHHGALFVADRMSPLFR
jgi:peptidoglycan/LPS O-acetylase OafA/YrhL